MGRGGCYCLGLLLQLCLWLLAPSITALESIRRVEYAQDYGIATSPTRVLP